MLPENLIRNVRNLTCKYDPYLKSRKMLYAKWKISMYREGMVLRDSLIHKKNANELEVEPTRVCTFLADSGLPK